MQPSHKPVVICHRLAQHHISLLYVDGGMCICWQFQRPLHAPLGFRWRYVACFNLSSLNSPSYIILHLVQSNTWYAQPISRHSDSLLQHSLGAEAVCLLLQPAGTLAVTHNYHFAVQVRPGLQQDCQQLQQLKGTSAALTVFCCLKHLRLLKSFRLDRASFPFEASGQNMHASSATPDGHYARFRSWDTPL